jgi:hypothetical protein
MNDELERDDAVAALNREMIADFHIFASISEQRFTVQQSGLMEGGEFASLVEAAQHLRREQPENAGWVVIHDGEGHLNRIPLRLSA